MAVRAIRAATQLSADDPTEMVEAVGELVEQVLVRNGLTLDEVISILFSATHDLTSQFAATAVRLASRTVPVLAGIEAVSLLDVQQMHVVGAMPRVIRAVVQVETDRTRAELVPVYLRGAVALQPATHPDRA